MPSLNCNILQRASIMEFFYVRLVVSHSWRRCTCTNVLFSLVAYEDCLELCFAGLVVERICAWCLIIVTIFIVWGMLKSHQLGVGMQVTKGGLFS